MKLSNNLTLEQRMNTEWGYQFDPMQCAEILDGARRGINAELYAKPDYDNIVMREIKEVLLKKPFFRRALFKRISRCLYQSSSSYDIRFSCK